MTIFLGLIGIGVVFLLYVLANFWMEGHRPTTIEQNPAIRYSRGNPVASAAIRHQTSLAAQGGLSVIPFPIGEREQRGRSAQSTTARRMIEMPMKRCSTR